MKKYIAGAAVVGLASFGWFAYAGTTKVDICHVTGSESNPFELITISEAAYDSHIAHGDQPVNDEGSCGDNGGGGGDPGGET